MLLWPVLRCVFPLSALHSHQHCCSFQNTNQKSCFFSEKEAFLLKQVSLKIWAQTWSSEQEKQYLGTAKGWSEASLEPITAPWNATLLGLECHRTEQPCCPCCAAARHGLVYPLCHRFGSPIPGDSLVEGGTATVH